MITSTPQRTPSHWEDDLSQVPALHLRQNLGFVYLAPSEALELWGHRKGNVVLESVLREQLSRLNHSEKSGQRYE